MFLIAAAAWGQPEVVISGLQGPQKVVLTPGGNLVISETNTNPNQGRISYVTRAGVRRSLFEGLPSGTEVVGGGSGPSAMALRERTLYVAIGAGDSERRGTVAGTAIHNPAGVSSPIFASILEIRFSRDVDAITGTFQMTTQHQQAISDGQEATLDDGAGGQARVSLLARFASEPHPVAIYKFSNPWGLALTEDGRTLFVNDASHNTLVRVDTATGRWQRILRFGPLPNPTPVGPPVIDAVPTSVRLYYNQLLVSFLTGFPFPTGYARVLAINPEQRTTEPFILDVSTAVDVLWRNRPNGQTQFFVLEYSQNPSATPPGPGRLLQYDSPSPQAVVSDLRAPTGLAYDASTQDLYILELSGRLLRLRLE